MSPLFQKKPVPTRRQIAAARQAELQDDMTLHAAYRRNQMLNTRHTATPVETSERTTQHRQADRRRRLLKRLGVLLVFMVVVLGLLWQLALNISVQTPDAASAKEADRYAATLRRYYEARPLERFRFLLDGSALTEFFATHAPEVKSVRVEESGMATAALKLTFRQPVAQWSAGDKKLFVDAEGVTFARSYTAGPTITVKDLSGANAEAGQEVVNARFLSFLGQVVAQFKQHGLIVTEVSLPPGTVRQVAFSLEGKPYSVRMAIDRTAEAQVGQAVKAMQHLDGRGERPSYLDVRVDQKVFYR